MLHPQLVESLARYHVSPKSNPDQQAGQNLTLGEIRTKFFPSISLVKKPIRWKTEWVDISHRLFQRHSTAAFFSTSGWMKQLGGGEPRGRFRCTWLSHWVSDSESLLAYKPRMMKLVFSPKKNEGLYSLVNIAGWNIPVFPIEKIHIQAGSIWNHCYVNLPECNNKPGKWMGEGFLKKTPLFLAVLRVFDVFFLDPGRSISFRLGRISGTAIRYVALIRKQEKNAKIKPTITFYSTRTSEQETSLKQGDNVYSSGISPSQLFFFDMLLIPNMIRDEIVDISSCPY